MPLLASTARRVSVVGVIAAGALLLFAAPAFAHITVTPDSAQAGSATVLTFHVPNEEANASTVKVDVQIPTDHPIAQFLVKPVPGWTSSVKTVKLAKPVTTDDGTFDSAVSEVVWTGGQILPGQFQDFTISADPLPTGIKQLVFKAIQTYSNGDVVRWIDLSQPGQPEPDHPAPTLTLTTAGQARAGTTTTATASADQASDGLARLLAIVGLLIGIAASLLALAATRRNRRLLADVATPAVATPASNGSPGTKRDPVLASTKQTPKRPQTRRRG